MSFQTGALLIGIACQSKINLSFACEHQAKVDSKKLSRRVSLLLLVFQKSSQMSKPTAQLQDENLHQGGDTLLNYNASRLLISRNKYITPSLALILADLTCF
jgi:hypothetical protein